MSQKYWTSPEGKELLAKAAGLALRYNNDPARVSLALHAKLPDMEPALISRACEIVHLRAKLARLSPCEKELIRDGLFSSASFQQASHPLIAKHHALRFKGCAHVLEIGSGLGFDTAALARTARRVTSVEKMAELAEMAALNFEIQGLHNIKLLVGDAEKVISSMKLENFDGLFADPSRRHADGRRIYNPYQYKPALDWLMRLSVRGVRGIKISPGLNLKAPDSGWKREWIGFNDECREQILWYNVDIRDGSVRLVDKNAAWEPPHAATAEHIVATKLTGGWVIEPHPALIRSGKLEFFFAEQGFYLIDTHLAYGVSETPPKPSPFYTSFRVLDTFPYQIRRLRAVLQELGWNSRTEIKQRGSGLEPHRIRAALKLCKPSASNKFGVVILARKGNEHVAILAERDRGD